MKMKRRIIAALMALCLCIGLLPATALAAEGPEVTGEGPYDGLGTNLVYFHIGTTDIYKMAMLKDSSVTAKTDIDSVKINFTDESRELTNTDPLDNKIYSAYWHNILGIQAQKANPSDLVSVEISYEEKSVTLNANELRLIGDHPWTNATGLYHIQAKDSSRHIVAFYDSRDSSTGDDGIFWLYHVAIVDNNSTVTNWPKDPEYISYTFGNWSTEKEGGSQFTQATVVNADTEAFAQKLSGVDVHAGTRIRIMNENDAILTRYVELYNAENDPDITINDINRESVKIAVHGTNGSTNPDYFVSEIDHNGWEDGYYLVFNRNADEIDPDSQLHNTHVPYTEVQSIEIFASLNGSSDVQSVTINKGTACGDFSTVIDQNDMYWNFTIKAPPTAPDDEDLTDDPDDPDDTGLLGDGAVTVECIKADADHESVTYGLKKGYAIGEVEWRDTGDAAAYCVDITNIAPDAYVTAYNTTIEDGHALSPADQGAKTITLKWVDSNWEVVSTVPVTFTVTCDDKVGDRYTLTYNYNQGGGSTTSDTADQTYAANESADLPEKISTDIDTDKDGVVFVGWTEKPNNYTKSTPATVEPTGMVPSVTFSNENITVHAVWAQDADNDDIPDYEDEDFAMQNVYVYAKPIGSGAGGALTEAEKGILKETYGLTLNEKGYCVLGKLENVLLPLASQQNIGQNYYNDSNYADVIQAAFAADKFKLHNSAADHQDLIKTLDWYHLGVASGADGYETEAPSSGLCWHLDGTLDISAKYKLTYDANGGTINGEDAFVVNGIALADAKNYTLSDEIVPTHSNDAVVFAGWTTDVDAKGKIYSVEDAKNGSVPAAVDAVDLTKNDTVYALWSYDEDNDGTPDINEIIVTPADITIYTGGTGYGGVTNADGTIIDDTSGSGLPKPGYHITLPAGLAAELGLEDGTDLAGKLSFSYSGEDSLDGKEGTVTRNWGMSYMGVYSTNPTRYVYSLNADTVTNTEVRLLFRDAEGIVKENDQIDMSANAPSAEYTMTINPGGLDQKAIKAVFTVNGGQPVERSVFIDTGTLTIRSITDPDREVTTPIVANGESVTGSTIIAQAGNGVTYHVNESEVPVAAERVHLLVDEVSDNQEFNQALGEDAISEVRTDEVLNVSLTNPAYDLAYLDLVDTQNGNAVVTVDSGELTIHWPVPADAAEDSEFYVVHYHDGMDRETPVDQNAVANINNTVKAATQDGDYITFTTSTFSPFALVYEKDGTTPADTVTVTFKVVNGTWRNGSSQDIVHTINKGTSLAANSIAVPTGMRADSGYTGGSWDTTPNTTTTLNGNVTYTYRFTRSGGGEYNPKDATLRFNSRGGTEFDDIVRDDPFEYNPYNKIPSRPGYRFTGWYDSSRLDNRYDEDEEISVPMGITTVFAGWEETSVPSMLNGDDHYAYIQGYSDGTVRPNANITRAQVATIFFRLLDEDVRDDNLTTYNTFPDVDEDYWANTAISTMASLGVINGRNSGLFDPDANITRAEFAAICARFDDSGVDGITTFTDTVGHWAEDEISRAAALGWIQGYADGTFRPNQYITRAQAVTMINRVLCRLPEDTDDLLSGMNTWTDCHEDDWFYLAIQEATNSHDFVAKDRVYESWTDLNRAPDWSRYE